MVARKVISSDINNPVVTIPGSKYLANRYIALAAIAEGVTRLQNLPDNDDIRAALQAIESLGATIKSASSSTVEIEGISDFVRDNVTRINCRDSGTLSRFITSVASNIRGDVTIDASEQMRQRPMEEVTQSLRALGVDVVNDWLPIHLHGPIKGGSVELDTSRSSQYLSGLLIACLKAESDTVIKLKGKIVSSSYVQLTRDAMKRFNGSVVELSDRELNIPANQQIKSADISVEADVVSSSYFMALALLAESSVTLKGYHFDSPQGEANFPEVLDKMGATVTRVNSNLNVTFAGPLNGIDVDMGDMPDAVPTLVVLALFARGETYITNIAHLAFKESNRIVDLCEELKKIGADIKYDNDSITVKYSEPELRVCELSSCHDHRLAMSFALIGIKKPGIIITNAQAVEKSFPLYWEYLEQAGLKTKVEQSMSVGSI